MLLSNKEPVLFLSLTAAKEKASEYFSLAYSLTEKEREK